MKLKTQIFVVILIFLNLSCGYMQEVNVYESQNLFHHMTNFLIKHFLRILKEWVMGSKK